MNTLILQKEDREDPSFNKLVAALQVAGDLSFVPLFGNEVDYGAILEQIKTSDLVICWK